MKVRFPAAAAWLLMLLAGNAPDVALGWWTGDRSVWTFWFRLDLAGAVALAGLLWPRFRSLRDFATVMFVIVFARYVSQFDLGPSPWLSGPRGFVTGMMGFQSLRVAGAALVVGALVLLGYRRRDFFLVRGAVDAPCRPMRRLGLPRSEPWTRFGPRVAAVAGALMLAWLSITAKVHAGDVPRMLIALPAVLPLAAISAFCEEVIFRAPLIATLEGPIGRRHALWISSLFFGIAHWSGVPWGWAGVLMATFFGWIMGRAMLETRGLLWAWIIHFVMDVVVFSFLAAGLFQLAG